MIGLYLDDIYDMAHNNPINSKEGLVCMTLSSETTEPLEVRPSSQRYADELLTSVELAHALKVSDRLPETWRLQGIGPKFIRAGGRRVLYRWSDVIQYLTARSYSSTSEESQQRAA